MVMMLMMTMTDPHNFLFKAFRSLSVIRAPNLGIISLIFLFYTSHHPPVTEIHSVSIFQQSWAFPSFLFPPPSSSPSHVFPKLWQGLSNRSPYSLHLIIHLPGQMPTSLSPGLLQEPPLWTSSPFLFISSPISRDTVARDPSKVHV